MKKLRHLNFKVKIAIEATLAALIVASFILWPKPVTVQASSGFLSVSLGKLSFAPAIGSEIVSKRTRKSKTIYLGQTTQNGTLVDKYLTTFVGSPEYTWDNVTKQYAEYLFQEKDTYYQAQHPWISVRMYDFYTEIWDEGFVGSPVGVPLIGDDHWTVQYLNKQGRWTNADANSVVRSYQITSDGIKLIKTCQTDIGVRVETYFFRNGSPLKITIQQFTIQVQTIQFVWNLSGISTNATLADVNFLISATGSTQLVGSKITDSNGLRIGQILWQDALASAPSINPIYSSDAQGKKITVTAGMFTTTVNGSATLDPTETFYPNADPESTSVDGEVGRVFVGSGEAWATIKAGAGNNAIDNSVELIVTQIRCYTTSNQWDTLRRGIVLFDTHTLGSVVVNSTNLSFYGDYKDNGASISESLNVYSSNPASNTGLVNADFTTLGTTALSDTGKSYANWNIGTPGTINTFVLNASGIATVNTTGISKFGLRDATYDVGSSTPSWVSGAQSMMSAWAAEKGAGFKPQLDVTYTSVSISNSPGSKAFGVVNPSLTYWSKSGNSTGPVFGAGGSFNSTNSSSSNSGTWTNPTNAYADNGGYADITSNSPSANQTYGTYGFGSIPANATITSLRVRNDAWSIGASTNRTNSPTAQSGWWTNPINAYDSAASYADINSGTPSNNQTYGTYGYNLSTETITSVKVKANAYTAGTAGSASSTEKSPSNSSGTWTNPTNAYALNINYATSGTNGQTEIYNNYGYSIPSDATINWVTVNVRAGATTNDKITLEMSSNNASSWLATTWTSAALGAIADNTVNVTAWTAWTPANINGNIVARVTQVKNGAQDTTQLDWIPIKVNYTTAIVYDQKLRADVSWDGGSTWSTSQNVTLTSANATYTFDFSSAVSWNGTYLNDTNFKVRIDAWSNTGVGDVRVSWIPVEIIYTALNNEQLNVFVTWDGGTSLSSAYTHSLNGTEQTFWDNVTTATSWTVTKLSDANFKVYVSGTTVGIDAGDVRLDWIPVEIYYTTPAGVTDGECFFTLTNDGGVSANISVKSFNFSSVGTSWNITDDSPGLNTVRLSIFRSGDSSSGNTTLALVDRVFKNNVATSTTVPWELRFETGTFSDGASNNTTIILSAIQS